MSENFFHALQLIFFFFCIMMLGSYQVEKYTERAAYLSSNFFQLSWILNHVHDIP